MKDTIFFIFIGICIVAMIVTLYIGSGSKASKKAKAISFISFLLIIVAMFSAIFVLYPPKPQSETTTETAQTSDENKKIASGIPLMVQFKEQGFTTDEAKTLEEQFNTMGIKQIDNLTNLLGNGIDNLQSFSCTIYDYSTLTFNFTIENRKLCYA